MIYRRRVAGLVGYGWRGGRREAARRRAGEAHCYLTGQGRLATGIPKKGKSSREPERRREAEGAAGGLQGEEARLGERGCREKVGPGEPQGVWRVPT